MFFRDDKIRSKYYQEVTKSDPRFGDKEYCVMHMREFDEYVRDIICTKIKEKQQEFNDKYMISSLHSSNNCFAKWGRYYYEIPFEKKTHYGSQIKGQISVMQHFAHSFCNSNDLDYTYFPNNKETIDKVYRYIKQTDTNHKIISTQSVASFKRENGVEVLKVMKNPKTGKLFFATVGGENITGAVSGNSVPEHPVVSLVQGDPSTENPDGKFYIIHEEGWGNDRIFDPILNYLDWIKDTYENVHVLFGDSNMENWESYNARHFNYIKTELEKREIPYTGIQNTTLSNQFRDRLSHNEYVQNYLRSIDLAFSNLSQCRLIVIIDMITRNDRLKTICKKLAALLGAEKSPIISYVTLYKEFDRDEMELLIERKNDEIAKQKPEEGKSLSEIFKSNAFQITHLLKKNGVRHFYHFTDRKNIASIKKHGGLYSWSYLEKHNISIPNPGGNKDSRNLDRNYGLEDFVRLSFCESHPMAYRKIKSGDDIITLKIAIDVATFDSTLFSNMNATDNKHKCGSTIEDLLRVNFVATQKKFIKNDDPDFKPSQAECMVKTCVPAKFILNLNDF